MRFIVSLALAATGVLSATANADNYSTPNPDTVYPGFESGNPVVIEGSKAFQTSPPKYPSPWAAGTVDWTEAYAKAKDFVSQLTLAEKVNLTTGTGWALERCVGQTGSIPRLAFRSLCLQDSPVGVRLTDFNSVFPAGVNVAATWDRKAAYDRGRAMGQEHKGKGVDIQLGPVAGPLGRVPEGGRNWEGFSPDPILTGQMFAETIKGIQSAGVMACGKHYIMNEQEHFRQVGESVGYGFNVSAPLSVNLDDETLHELYLWPFADGVKAGMASVMCGYVQVNNSQACQNSYLQNYILKGELGFQGFIVSDWLATHSGVSSVIAGLDMTMPGETTDFNTVDTYFGANLTIAVLNGTVPAWRIDDMAIRIMAGFYYVDAGSGREPVNFSSWTKETFGFEYNAVSQGGITKVNHHVDVRRHHSALIRRHGAESTVLLKNVDHTLPLSGKEPLTAVFGNDAGPSPRGPNSCGDRGCDDGTLGMAWGSGSAEFPYLVTPDTAIQNKVLSNGGIYESSLDNSALDIMGALARRANVSIFFANSDSGEGYIQVDGNIGDRNNLTFWQNAEAAIQTVAGNCDNTILVVHSVGPNELEKYQNHPNITAILWAGVPGQESGNSIVDILYGHVNPSAKLPFTIGKSRRDYGVDVLYTPNYPVPQIQITEGKFIDYRTFDAHNITPTYEFGFGLSYTTFKYSNLKITKVSSSEYIPFQGTTKPAPTFGHIKDPSDYTFPSNFTRVSLFHYPWINSTDLSAASGDPNYGQAGSIPDKSRDGSAQSIPRAGGAPGGNPSLYEVIYQVEATITNTGKTAGYEVPQLYLSRGGRDDPVRELRGFDKLWLEPAASQAFSVHLTRRDLASWSVLRQDWFVRDARKKIWVGPSSRLLPLEAILP